MHIKDLPNEIISDILLLATKANQEEGVQFTYGLGHDHLKQPEQEYSNRVNKFVRGPLSAESLRWDATSAIRRVCQDWHTWALSYNLEHVFERRWQGSERWADLTLRRLDYPVYELITRPAGYPLYRDPYGSLKHTDRLFSEMPATAGFVRRLWFNGFFTAETDKLILSVISKCPGLQYLSVPWTILRRASADDWINLLNVNTGVGTPLQSLELTAVCLPVDQALALENDCRPNPLEDDRVDFSHLKRLKIFGNTLDKPVCDTDLAIMARTATNLECLDITNLSTISVAGMLALVKASSNSLQVLEHSPRSDDGFYHPYPGHLDSGEHLCEHLAALPRMKDLSISLPYICADFFTNPEVKWEGDLQVRFADLCGCSSKTSASVRADKLRTVLEAARRTVKARKRMHHHLSAELFFAGCIFQPEKGLVHGDFSLAEISSNGQWPEEKNSSTLGPYGNTGTYGKEEAWDSISEEDYLEAVKRGWVSLQV